MEEKIQQWKCAITLSNSIQKIKVQHTVPHHWVFVSPKSGFDYKHKYNIHNVQNKTKHQFDKEYIYFFDYYNIYVGLFIS